MARSSVKFSVDFRQTSQLNKKAVKDPMKIQVLYFAALRERLNRTEEWLDLPDGATAGAALALLSSRYAPVAGLSGVLRVAVNEAFAPAEQPLQDGDVLALVPPVAGGSGPVSAAGTARPAGPRSPRPG